MVKFKYKANYQLIKERNKTATCHDAKHSFKIKRFMNMEMKSGKELRIRVEANNVGTSLARRASEQAIHFGAHFLHT